MAPMLSERPPVFTMQQGSQDLEDRGDHWISGDYYRDSQLLLGSHRYGICILKMFHVKLM